MNVEERARAWLEDGGDCYYSKANCNNTTAIVTDLLSEIKNLKTIISGKTFCIPAEKEIYDAGYCAGLDRGATIAESKGAHCIKTGDCASDAIAAAIRAEKGAEE